MKKDKSFIYKNPEFITIIVALVACVIIGYIYDILEIMLQLFLGAIVFGAIVGLISFLIKIFSK